MTTTEADSLPDLPPQVSRILGEFVDRAQTAFAGALRSIVLYGSAAEGRLRSTSDVNVLLIVARFDYLPPKRCASRYASHRQRSA